MKIYIDISVLTLATFVTGIQRVTQEIAVRLIDKYNDDIVLLHYNAKDNVYYRIDNTLFCEYYLYRKGIKNRMITRKKVLLEEIGKGSIFFDLDAAWMCRVKRSYLLPILKKQGAIIIAHVYDIISITHPQYCLQRGVYNFMDFIGAHLQYADKVIVNANATKLELERLAERLKCSLPPCCVVPLGANFSEKNTTNEGEIDQEVMAAVENKPYILMVGTIEPRKNHKLLVEAYDRGLKKLGYNVIFAGYMGWNMEEFEQRLKEHPHFGKGIYHFTGLGDNEISYLYRHAKFLAFCSYTEGYGLPIIEALQRGTPVIAADVPVLREVGGEYCVWFEQDNAEELCEKIKYYALNESEYESLREQLKSFSNLNWNECAGMMLKQIAL